MEPDDTNQDPPVKKDEDVTFELEKEPETVSPETITPARGVGETTLPAKEDTLGNSDFPPLSEEEKQPKLPDIDPPL